MKIAEFKKQVQQLSELKFRLPGGRLIPEHFHITEAGRTTKHFVDCGGTLRKEEAITLQLWVAEDTRHRLQPQKLLKIISIYEQHFGTANLEVEVEYQSGTIGRYGLDSANGEFMLTSKFTDCLASDTCGVSKPSEKSAWVENATAGNSCCKPGSNCC